ncbi:MAG: SDR family NAD(P)-dependent oxidoreductase, partial [Pseudorhodobacter sp.]|nr:SDR family NAD(P)-dependent oxidoreductase [Pseudorhodobacter sp.]
EDAEMTPMARSFYAENKRVRNDRIKQDLHVTLQYPTYREGLQSLLTAENP